MTPLLNLQSGEDTDSKAHIVLYIARRLIEACSNQYHAVALDISGYGKNAPLSFIVLPLPPRRAAVAGSRAYRKWRGAAPLRGR